MTKRVAAPIVTTTDLKELQAENPNAIVVGVTKSGTIYRLDGENPKSMNVTEAALFLGIHEDYVRELQRDPAGFRFPSEERVAEARENAEATNEIRETKNEIKVGLQRMLDGLKLNPVKQPPVEAVHVPNEVAQPPIKTDAEKLAEAEKEINRLEAEKSDTIKTLSDLIEKLVG